MKITSASNVYAIAGLWVGVLIGSSYLFKGTMYAGPVKESLSTITLIAFVMLTITWRDIE